MTERGFDMQVSRKRTPYRECPLCGSHLDAGEVCDCKQEQQAALVEREEKGLVAICREIDKDTGRIAVYRVEQEIGENVLKCLQLRAQFNPEMRYFVTTAAHFNGFRDSTRGPAVW